MSTPRRVSGPRFTAAPSRPGVLTQRSAASPAIASATQPPVAGTEPTSPELALARAIAGLVRAGRDPGASEQTVPSPINASEWFTTDDLSKLLAVPPATIRTWRYLGTGPSYVKLGRLVRYSRAAVESWIAGATRGGSSAG